MTCGEDSRPERGILSVSPTQTSESPQVKRIRFTSLCQWMKWERLFSLIATSDRPVHLLRGALFLFIFINKRSVDTSRKSRHSTCAERSLHQRSELILPFTHLIDGPTSERRENEKSHLPLWSVEKPFRERERIDCSAVSSQCTR